MRCTFYGARTAPRFSRTRSPHSDARLIVAANHRRLMGRALQSGRYEKGGPDCQRAPAVCPDLLEVLFFVGLQLELEARRERRSSGVTDRVRSCEERSEPRFECSALLGSRSLQENLLVRMGARCRLPASAGPSPRPHGPGEGPGERGRRGCSFKQPQAASGPS